MISKDTMPIQNLDELVPFHKKDYASQQLGLGAFWEVEWGRYNQRPYLDANYWIRFNKWLEDQDIFWHAQTDTLYFKNFEHLTMFLLTYPPR